MFHNTSTLNHSKSLRGFLALALALCLCLSPMALAGCSSDNQGGSSSAQSASDTIAVKLTVTNGEEDLLAMADVEGLATGATVLEALEAGPLEVVAEDSQYGPYVTSIGGVAADSTHGWVYTVNGEQAAESAGTMTVAAGDDIVWSYIEFTPETA